MYRRCFFAFSTSICESAYFFQSVALPVHFIPDCAHEALMLTNLNGYWMVFLFLLSLVFFTNKK